MNVENYIKEEMLKLKNSRRRIEYAPEINEKNIFAIKNKYKSQNIGDIEKYIIVMSYTSTGWFFITGDRFFYNNFMQEGLKIIRFKDILNVVPRVGKGLFSIDGLMIAEKNGKIHELDGCVDGIDVRVLASIINRIIEVAKDNPNEEFTISEQGVMTYQLPEDIKLLYLEILCNYAYINDQTIAPEEYNAIAKFSVRMELQSTERVKLQKYMNDFDNRVKTGYLIKIIKEKTMNQSGQRDAVKYCLIQDALYIHNIQSAGKNWREDGFIGSLLECFKLNPEQIDTMEEAVKLNTEMLKKDSDMADLKRKWTDLIKRTDGTTKYIPTAYLFCSGSIYGIKSYTGFLKSSEKSQKAINKQRELILQEVIMNNQKTVNVLIGDMNYIAERLEKALENEDKIEKEYREVKNLVRRIKSAYSITSEERALKKDLKDSQIKESEDYEKE